MTEPAILEVSAAALGRVIGVSTRRVNSMVTEGVLSRTATGRFALGSAVRAYLEHVRRARSAPSDEHRRERLAWLAARRRLAELDVEAREGRLLDRATVSAVWDRVQSNAKTRLLAMPSKLAPELAPETSPVRCQELIRAEVYAALNDLADGKGTNAA